MDDRIRAEELLISFKEQLAAKAREAKAMEIGGAFFAPYILAAAEAEAGEERQAQVNQDAQMRSMIERPGQLLKEMQKLHFKYGFRPIVGVQDVKSVVSNEIVEVESVPMQNELVKIHLEHVKVTEIVPTVRLRGGSLGDEYDVDDFLEDDETVKIRYPRKDSAICMDFDAIF